MSGRKNVIRLRGCAGSRNLLATEWRRVYSDRNEFLSKDLKL